MASPLFAAFVPGTVAAAAAAVTAASGALVSDKKEKAESLEAQVAAGDEGPRRGPCLAVEAAAATAALRAAAAAPGHCARVFLRERSSGRYLSILPGDVDLQDAACVMTEVPSSMFVCHQRGARAASTDDAFAVLGLEHEGLPAFGRFVAARARAPLGLFGGLGGGGGGRAAYELRCGGRQLGEAERFRWHADSTVQHALSGRWLYVDPLQPDKVLLHASKRSVWEVDGAMTPLHEDAVETGHEAAAAAKFAVATDPLSQAREELDALEARLEAVAAFC